MAATLSGPWSLKQIEQFLNDSTVPMRVACVGKDGFPRVVSVWFMYRDERLLCVTHDASHLARLLKSNAQVGFEIAPDHPPYHGVRGQGVASLSELGTDPALEKLLENYLGGQSSRVGKWLLSRKEEEILVSIKPTRLFSWDYRERMADVAS